MTHGPAGDRADSNVTVAVAIQRRVAADAADIEAADVIGAVDADLPSRTLDLAADKGIREVDIHVAVAAKGSERRAAEQPVGADHRVPVFGAIADGVAVAVELGPVVTAHGPDPSAVVRRPALVDAMRRAVELVRHRR